MCVCVSYTKYYIIRLQNMCLKSVNYLLGIGTLLQTVNDAPLKMYSKFVLLN